MHTACFMHAYTLLQACTAHSFFSFSSVLHTHGHTTFHPFTLSYLKHSFFPFCSKDCNHTSKRCSNKGGRINNEVAFLSKACSLTSRVGGSHVPLLPSMQLSSCLVLPNHCLCGAKIFPGSGFMYRVWSLPLCFSLGYLLHGCPVLGSFQGSLKPPSGF